jgi:hypothetical protein
MSQKSSVPQAVSFVSQVLKRHSVLPRLNLPSWRTDRLSSPAHQLALFVHRAERRRGLHAKTKTNTLRRCL